MALNTQVLTNENWTTVMWENLIQLDLEVAWLIGFMHINGIL